MSASLQPSPAVLRACVQDAVRSANRLVGLSAAGAALVVFGSELHAVGPLVVIAATAAGGAVGVRFGIRRARRIAACLAPEEVAEVLRPFSRHEDEVARQVATALLGVLPARGSEVTAASAPLAARGDEATPPA